MRSSEETFRRLRRWKERRTVLKATLRPKDKNSSFESRLMVSVFSVQESEGTFGMAIETRPHGFFLLELKGAECVMEEDGKSLNVVLPDGERWLFVEALPC